MENKQVNENIGCTVSQCANHAKESNFCCLPKVQIGTHEQNPTVCQCTDCESFVPDGKRCHCGTDY